MRLRWLLSTLAAFCAGCYFDDFPDDYYDSPGSCYYEVCASLEISFVPDADSASGLPEGNYQFYVDVDDESLAYACEVNAAGIWCEDPSYADGEGRYAWLVDTTSFDALLVTWFDPDDGSTGLGLGPDRIDVTLIKDGALWLDSEVFEPQYDDSYEIEGCGDCEQASLEIRLVPPRKP
jgi:hypothetical protein